MTKLVFVINLVAITMALLTIVSSRCDHYTNLCVLLVSSVIAWFTATFIHNLSNKEQISTANKAVLITGCDSGFGHQVAIECHRLGFHVFAGVLFDDGEGARHLRDVCPDRIRIIKLNVTVKEDIINAVDQIKQSGIELWSVVNNAGIGLYCPFEWGEDIKQLTDVLDVNLLGMARVTKYCLPLLRRSQGRIVNVCSLLGRMSMEGIVHYCISKHGARSFSEGLRQEVDQFGIRVVTIEPAFYRTAITEATTLSNRQNTIWEQTPREVQLAYTEEYKKKFEHRLKTSIAFHRTQTSEVVTAMVNAVALKWPNNNYKCGGIVDYLTLFPISYLPERFQKYFMNFVFEHILARL